MNKVTILVQEEGPVKTTGDVFAAPRTRVEDSVVNRTDLFSVDLKRICSKVHETKTPNRSCLI